MPVLYSFPSGERGEVRAYLQEFKGECWAHVRRFEPSREDGAFTFTKKGIAVRPHELRDLLVAVAALVAANEVHGA